MRFSAALLWTVFARELILVASLGNAVVLARLLGPSGVGTTSLVITIATLLSQGLNIGFTSSNHILVARTPADAGRLFTQSLLPMLLLGVPMAALVLSFPGQSDFVFGSLGGRTRVVVLIGTGLLILNQNLNALIFGLQWYRCNGLLNALAPLGIVLTNLTLAMLGLLTVDRALDAWLGWNLATALASFAFLSRQHPPKWGVDPALLKESLSIGFRALSLSLLTLLAYRVMLILVDRELGRDAVGHYSMALSIAALLEHVPQVLGSLIINRVSAKQIETADVARLLRAHWIFSGLIVVALELLGPYAMTLVFGDRYVNSIPPLRILALGYYFSGAWSVATGYLNGRYGCPPSVVVLSALTFAVSLGLGLVFIPLHGLRGAAAAWSLSGGSCALLILGVLRADAGSGLRWRDFVPGPADLTWIWSKMRTAFPPAK